MHDGSESTLMQVVEFYDKGGIKNPQLASEITPLNLTMQEKNDLVAFIGIADWRRDQRRSADRAAEVTPSGAPRRGRSAPHPSPPRQRP